MRDIKFRVWDNQLIKWANNPEVRDSVGLEFGIKDYFIAPSGNKAIRWDFMQYIGLRDKYGVEIYEWDYLVDRFPADEEDLSKGDIESLLPVVWCKDQLMWCVDVSFAKDGSYLTSIVQYFGEFLEVKGNIHECNF